MTEFLRRHSLLLASFLLIASSFQLMSLSIQNRTVPQFGARAVNSVLSPVEKLYHEIVESGRYLWGHYVALLDVETERDSLLMRVKALEASNARMAELESDFGRLRDLLSFSNTSELSGVAAAVIGRDPSNWVRTITIDRGSAEGLRPGLAVVDGRAVVGQTIVVSEHSSKVLLLTDNSSAIAALLQSSRAQGIAEGTLAKKLQLGFVMKDYKVEVGDRVVASGLDGVFPKGVLVGVVTDVPTDNPGMFQTISVQPSVDLNRLENVLVILPPSGGAAGKNAGLTTQTGSAAEGKAKVSAGIAPSAKREG